ncbi:MAG: bifunctional 4-hydroxy-3-methylbut-2-enyl diphosphate reductase/30S ribosomal protein S1 [Bacillota bacterium]
MHIHLADNAGFCYGVKRAVDLAVDASVEDGPWHTLGPLVHNREVTAFLADKGITCVNDTSEITSGGVLIRSHGVPPEVLSEIESRGLGIIDATCPNVKHIQELARKLTDDHYQIVIVGDKDHPEVKGILGWAGNTAIVARLPEEAANLLSYNKIAVLCQTTIRESEYQQIVEELISHAREIRGYNTICNASIRRQQAAAELAGHVDVMVVVGDRDSSNTRSLVKICEGRKVTTYQIETAAELRREWFEGIEDVGVTAGASTPDWVIKEVLSWMSELESNVAQDEQAMNTSGNQEVTFAELEAEMAESMREVEKGTILRGRVIQIGQDEVMVDVGGKSEGIIPLRELSVQEIKSPSEVVAVGDEIDVMVLRWDDDGTILVSKRRVDQEVALDRLEEAANEGKTVTGKVLKTIKGGLLVDVGVTGFLPASQVEDGFVRDLEKYVGQELSYEILEFNRHKRRGSQVVLSRSRLIEKEKEARKNKFWDEIAEGQIRMGVVKRITDYGAFIDLGGFEGLLHVSEIDHARVARPEDVLTEGEEIEVYVLGVDRETQRVSLSRKKVIPSPWQKIAEKVKVGDILTGTVVRLAQFGAFVELEPGIDGLVHISQLADRRVAKTEDVVEAGQEVKVKVISMDTEAKRIGLSIKEAELEAEKEQVAAYLENQDNQEN